MWSSFSIGALPSLNLREIRGFCVDLTWNDPNGDFPLVLIHRYLNKGQNGQKIMGPKQSIQVAVSPLYLCGRKC